MHPLLRNVVVGAVGFLLAAALVVLGLLRAQSPSLQVAAMVGAGLLGALTAGFLFWQAWRWSVRSYRDGYTGRSIAIAVAGGLAGIVGMASLAGAVIMLLLFAGTLGA
ncbi:MAG: hypothetical protein M3295_09660 [Chloroflexota bacterium]|nr:hypothetical protein [Chloroflexota bacterium]